MDSPDLMQAVVQTFHIDQEHIGELAEGLDTALTRFRQSTNFGGLLCLERDGRRQQVTVIVLWRANALDELAPEVAEAHRHIAVATDFGVTSETYRVVRFAPGAKG